MGGLSSPVLYESSPMNPYLSSNTSVGYLPAHMWFLLDQPAHCRKKLRVCVTKHLKQSKPLPSDQGWQTDLAIPEPTSITSIKTQSTVARISKLDGVALGPWWYVPGVGGR